MASVELGFRLRGIDGQVHVTFERNDEPELMGSGPQARGFPWCDATVEYSGRGYDGVLGWVQLVRSDDNASGGREFEIDPLEFLGDVPHPFCWIGLEPHLFDAPSRELPAQLDWQAHSWLCVPDGGLEAGLSVHALCGFSWGFQVAGEQITLTPPTALEPSEWDVDASVLTRRHPRWRFAPGFRRD